MTFTIQVPVFPMRKEIDARKARKTSSFLSSIPGFSRHDRRRSRDAEGFVEMEMLPLDELEGVRRPTPKPGKGRTSS
ncbi:hypothetical protein [Azorhizobium doebereinerae]|uniref:hypothetical protein n=1 Tax=Azorhizobium doebereinerae TaxID=281091 RepID=UPI00048B95D6|nr:hypothetical protein [Azorhizobium doebereinerae]